MQDEAEVAVATLRRRGRALLLSGDRGPRTAAVAARLGMEWQAPLLPAAWCLVVTGVISIARGAGHLSFGSAPPPGCPFCAAKEAEASAVARADTGTIRPDPEPSHFDSSANGRSLTPGFTEAVSVDRA